MPEEPDDQNPERVSTDEPAKEPSSVVVVLSEDPNTEPGIRRRRVQRREESPFTQEERLAIEQEIIEANTGMRDVEETKKAQDKAWNGQIAEHEATMNDAIDVLKKGTFMVDVERIEEFNYASKEVIYYNVETDKEVDRRDMTEEELQTKMKM